MSFRVSLAENSVCVCTDIHVAQSRGMVERIMELGEPMLICSVDCSSFLHYSVNADILMEAPYCVNDAHTHLGCVASAASGGFQSARLPGDEKLIQQDITTCIGSLFKFKHI